MVICIGRTWVNVEKSRADLIMLNRILLILTLFFLLIISGCEDDPLLAPQSVEEEDGGSYGNLSLPKNKEDTRISNPEIF